MKRLASIIGIVAASVLSASMPLLSAENIPMGNDHKNECLLVSKNCGDNVDSLQQRIEKLRTEISRGTLVYTEDELMILKNKLDDAVKTLEIITLGA